jgi:hypothetical protein
LFNPTSDLAAGGLVEDLALVFLHTGWHLAVNGASLRTGLLLERDFMGRL